MDAPGTAHPPETRPEITEAIFGGLVADLGLDAHSGWRDLGGSRSRNLLVRDRAGLKVVRVHRRSMTRERLSAEQQARHVLWESGIAAVPALTTTSTIDGHLVEVEPYVRSDGRMNTAERLRDGFAVLAGLHDVLRRADLPPAARAVVDANHVALGRSVEATRQGADRVRGWGDRVLTRYADDVTELVAAVTAAEHRHGRNRRTQVVHGDFWDDNVLFAGERLTAVLDFGFMAERLRVEDLALAFWFFLLEPGRQLPGDAERTLLTSLLEAYDEASDRPLTRQERLSLPLVTARQPAWSIGGWVRTLDRHAAREHAVAAAAELPVAAAVWRDLALWQDAATG